MRKYTIVLVIISVLLVGCSQGGVRLTANEAKTIMDTEVDFLLVDVRTQEEYDSGYIPGALLIPHTNIREMAPDLLPDPDQKILLYCRTGRRSEAASKTLIDMGYTNVFDMGGINDWNYDIVKP
ncbi:rhodanese-like domain-containing protein [Petrocella sp. FN5]|uniref:rhodanese-like domain-containing protein n=1 Tax=Petrocella sp. FN5 TaxID=3032002 RepID=UPI0023DAC809|nr:rhodanese-like domain-containing protein [Petrocella sp. FN5]MDF1618089.1 rhodanese-like domain-containing protein [Petrocella sp. FN5]